MTELKVRDVFLSDPPQRGYPEDYFIARLRGKRQRLIREWDRVIYGRDVSEYFRLSDYEFYGGSPWMELLRRYKWLYAMMNERFREMFCPYFIWIEFKTLLVCLRYIKAGYREKAERIFRYSLLSERIKDILVSTHGFDRIIEALSSYLMQVNKDFGVSYNIFLEKGFGSYEIYMNNSLLKYLSSIKLQDEPRFLISRLIDIRNLLNLYKSIRWNVNVPVEFIPGGTIKIRDLESMWKDKQFAPVLNTVRKTFPLPQYSTPGGAGIEDSLLKGLSILLKRLSYKPGFIGLVLYYLWSLFVELRNLGTVIEGVDLDRTTLLTEMI